MDQPVSNMAEQIAHAAHRFERERTGHGPKSVNVVLSDDTLLITLDGALSPAEQALAKTPAGANQVQEFHRRLFADSIESLRREIERITGVRVREAATELETARGSMVQVFTTGTVVQVFLLACPVPPGTWSECGGEGQSLERRC